jgi:hypothetical protein
VGGDLPDLPDLRVEFDDRSHDGDDLRSDHDVNGHDGHQWLDVHRG